MMISSRNKDAPNIIGLIKPDSVGAEIGVWKANTSILFLEKKIKKLYMIDPYAVDNYEYLGETYMQNFYAKYSKITGEFSKAGFMRYYDNLHKEVVAKVSRYEAAEVCRMTSDAWFKKYNDIELDWIYVDGDHSYDATFKDLNNSLKVVKKGGMILGDDYYWHNSKDGKRGVTDAVDEFISKNNFKIYRHGQTQFQINV